MAGKQEVLTKADADMAVEERKALGLENRTNERHQLRMSWYRQRAASQVASAIVASMAFAAVTFVAVQYGWWIAVIAAGTAGACIAMQAIISATAQPPEER